MALPNDLTSTRPLNVAVVGASLSHSPDGREKWGARTHLPALKKLPELFNLVAVCTSRAESARETADKFEVPHAFSDYHELLKLPELDVVTIVVRPSLHHPIAMACLEAGKHVYCELPLAQSSQQASEMVALAGRQGVKTALGCQGHFWPAVQRMRALISGGYIGRPLAFSACWFVSAYIAPRPAHRQWMFDPRDGGGPGYRAGHLLHRVTTVLGHVRSISADFSQLVPERALIGESGTIGGSEDDNFSFLVELEGGIRGTIQVCLTALNGTGMRFEVYGTEGTLMLVRPHPSDDPGGGDPDYLDYADLYGAHVDLGTLARAKVPPEKSLHPVEPIAVVGPDFRALGFNPRGGTAVVYLSLEAFGNAIRRDEHYEPSFETGLKLHELLESAQASSDQRRWVECAPTS